MECTYRYKAVQSRNRPHACARATEWLCKTRSIICLVIHGAHLYEAQQPRPRPCPHALLLLLLKEGYQDLQL